MPKFDKTGPEGKGPRTGRRLGPCEDDTKTFGRPRPRIGRKGRAGRAGRAGRPRRERGWSRG